MIGTRKNMRHLWRGSARRSSRLSFGLPELRESLRSVVGGRHRGDSINPWQQ